MCPQYSESRLVERLAALTQVTNTCHLWMGDLNQDGYGRVWAHGQLVRVHRLTWEMAHGPIPPGVQVNHTCDVYYPPGDVTYRRCRNLDHLQLGTHATNNAHMSESGRAAFGERNPNHTHPERRPRGERHGAVLHPPTVRGEASCKAKLTEAKVRSILQNAERGVRATTLARQYGVNESAIRKIVTRETWKHIDPKS